MITLYNSAMAYARINATDGNAYTANSAGAISVPDNLKMEFIASGFSMNAGGGGAAAWGDIAGDIANQTDLVNALGEKATITGATTIAVVEEVPGEPDPATIYFPTGE